MKAIRKSERGFSLIIGMSVLILLTVLGVTVMQSISSDVDAAGSDRGAQSALAIAEAGLSWSLDYLKTSYQLDTGGAAIFNNIATNSRSDLTSYSGATDEEKLVYKAENFDTTKWQCITHNRTTGEKSFGGGRYVVWAGLDPADDSGNTLLVRSLGIDARGAQRLVEIAVKAGASP